MADFEKAIPGVLKWEGGFVNHPADPGGATNRGIIFTLFKVYAEELGMQPTVDALKNLTEEQAKHIYKVHFWDRMKGDLWMHQDLANIVFDGFVNCGYNGIKLIQRCLKLKDDGIVGPATLLAVNTAEPSALFVAYRDARRKYYNDLAERKPQMTVFLKGWLNRINSFELTQDGLA